VQPVPRREVADARDALRARAAAHSDGEAGEEVAMSTPDRIRDYALSITADVQECAEAELAAAVAVSKVDAATVARVETMLDQFRSDIVEPARVLRRALVAFILAGLKGEVTIVPQSAEAGKLYQELLGAVDNDALIALLKERVDEVPH
jgi:hypothetical protein